MRSVLYLATPIGITTYMFWEYLPKGSFYIGNGILFFLLCLYIFIADKKSYISYILFCLSINNLFEEIIGQNTILQLKEILFFILILSIPLLNKNGGKISKLCRPSFRLHSKIHNTRNSRNINTSGDDSAERKDNPA